MASAPTVAAALAPLDYGIRNGVRLVIHCAGGLGRAGTIGACLRLRLKLDSDPREAIASIRRMRSQRAIETAGQEMFICLYANRIS